MAFELSNVKALINEKEKKFLHDEGLNIIAMDETKQPIDKDGHGLTGKIKTELKEIEQYVLEAKNWGVRHSVNFECENILFIDWEEYNQIPETIAKVMVTYRDNPGGRSYHSIIKVTDADKKWCNDFKKNYAIEGTMEIFTENKNMAHFGNYKHKTGNGQSPWFYSDSQKEQQQIIRVTKKELGKYFTKQKTAKDKNLKNYKQRKTRVLEKRSVVLPGGRHNAFLVRAFEYLVTADESKGEKDREAIFDYLITEAVEIQGREIFESDRRNELMDIIDYALDHHSENASFYYMKQINEFATINNIGKEDQFNTWYYDKIQNIWNEDTPKFILTESKKIAIEESAMSSGGAIELSRQISVDEDTLRVSINDEYMKQKMKKIIDDYGNYFDLDTGEIKQIDPKVHFFTESDVSFELKNNTGVPEKFIEFLQTRCGVNWEIVRDHLATIFLHNSMLGSKAKMSYYVGDHNTYKSLLIGLVQSFIKSQSNVAVSQLTKDNFSPALLANKLLNYSEEEEVSIVQNQAMLKDLITKLSGPYRDMHSTKLRMAHRWPRWEIAL